MPDKRLKQASKFAKFFSRSFSNCVLAAIRYIRYTIIFPYNLHMRNDLSPKNANCLTSNAEVTHVCHHDVTIYNN